MRYVCDMYYKQSQVNNKHGEHKFNHSVGAIDLSFSISKIYFMQS